MEKSWKMQPVSPRSAVINVISLCFPSRTVGLFHASAQEKICIRPRSNDKQYAMAGGICQERNICSSGKHRLFCQADSALRQTDGKWTAVETWTMTQAAALKSWGRQLMLSKAHPPC